MISRNELLPGQRGELLKNKQEGEREKKEQSRGEERERD